MLPRRLLVVLGALALVFAACGGGGDDSGGGSGAQKNVVIGDADEGIEGVKAIRVGPNTHTEGTIDYGLRPPAGGMHNPAWANCGFYDEPIPDEHIVHTLEHGAVWLAYAPDLPAADVDVIHDITRQNPRVIATPYEDLESGVAVVATAWARQLTLNDVRDPRVEQFVAQYVDGPQAPEAGGYCTGSPIGEPIP